MLDKFRTPIYKCPIAKKRYTMSTEDMLENAPYPMHWMADKMIGESRHMDKSMYNRNRNLDKAISEAMKAFGHMFEDLDD